jgi:hypothetical protein
MVTALLRELAGPFQPIIPFEYAREVTRAWERACDAATRSGSADDLHAARDDYQTALLAHLKILDGWLTLLARFPNEYPDGFADRMASNRDELQRHYDVLFSRWQTIDDLEALLLERASLSNEQLKALAVTHAPPQAWYDEPDTAAKE